MVESMRTTIPVVVVVRSLDRRCRPMHKIDGLIAGDWSRRRRGD